MFMLVVKECLFVGGAEVDWQGLYANNSKQV